MSHTSDTPRASLTTFDIYCMAAGAMISSGLFVLPGVMLGNTGPALVTAYLLAGLLVFPALLSQAELSTAMPRSGGSYFHIERALGLLAGAIAGACGWLAIVFKSAFALVGLGAAISSFHPDPSYRLVQTAAIIACALLTLLNAVSVRHAGRLQNVLVVGLLATLCFFILDGGAHCRAHNFAGVLSGGRVQTLYFAAMVFISFGGLTHVASVAEEIRDPGRSIPLGMITAALSVWLIYILCTAVLVGLDVSPTLAGSLSPLADAAADFAGAPGRLLLLAAGLMAFVTTANSGILSASRQPLAMARDGMLPARLASVSPRTGTPLLSVLLTGAAIALLVATTRLDTLVKAASTVMLGMFAMLNVSVIIMRRSGLQNYRPLFRSPLYPWLQIAGAAIYLGMIALMGRAALSLVTVFAAVVVLWWLLVLRHRALGRQSALLYMVRNLASPDFERAGLEDELRAIALERDAIVHDRFDTLVKDCRILDLPGSVTAKTLFNRIAAAMAEEMNTEAATIRELLDQREQRGSTAIIPGLAIPHVICPGEGRFALVLARCVDGAVLPGASQPVRIVFAMASTPDQRNYHLKALMAVAHIVSEHDFVRRWLAAPDIEHLRDLILLSDRDRFLSETSC